MGGWTVAVVRPADFGGGGSARLAMTEAISFRGQRQTRRLEMGMKSLGRQLIFRLHTSARVGYQTVPIHASDVDGGANN